MSPTAVAPSATTLASQAFVAAHLEEARALGERLVGLVADASSFTAALNEGFASLGDPVYAEGVRRVTPGLGPVFGVRQPLMTETHRAFKRGTRKAAPEHLLRMAARLVDQEPRELRWFAIWTLSRTLPADPEGSWQLLRKIAALADEWITVDTLAHPYAEGILADGRRWAEVEGLVCAPSRWQRRLVGSTLAVMVHASGRGGRSPETVARGLLLIGQLIGDHEPDVQKALSWPLRDFTAVDRPAVVAFLERETALAARTDDGHRAWVIRDTLTKIPADRAAAIKTTLEGIRRRPGAPSTSRAALTAAPLGSGEV